MTRKRAHRGNRRRGTHPKAHKPRMLLEGTLQILRPGLAQVQTAEGTYFVARRGVREAMNGDEVQVSLVPMHGRGGERVAYVQAVLQRKCTSLVGTYSFADPLGIVTPLDGRLSHDFFVLPDDKSAQRGGVSEGDVVVARIVEYPTRKSSGVVTIERRLGSSTELDVDVEAVIASYGMATEFPQAALAEAEAMSVDASQALEADPLRRDLRDHMCVTVDPADARDYDDAVGVAKLDGGGYRVFVHIADVTHYVGWFSSIDAEARSRTCSVYLVDRVIPMLPERLCNDICSLRANEDRLTMTAEIELDKSGRIMDFEVFPSVIRSRARLSYDVVDEFLENKGDVSVLPCRSADQPKIGEMLVALDEVAQLRQCVRRGRGSIDFATVESKVVLDSENVPTDIVVRKRTRATGLVEEAMLMANECVAKMLADHDLNTAYRVHERPSPEDLLACVPVLRELGVVDARQAERIAAGEAHAIQEALDSAEGTGASYLVNTLLLRAQKRAVYEPHNEGHYALGAKAYCHFTSPIRRYPDVLVHRAVKWLIRNTAQTKDRTEIERSLPQLCHVCSERERMADSASRDSQKIKMAQYYGERLGQKFSGVVAGCERFGLFVVLDDTGVEGLLPVHALGDEWFTYDETRLCLRGESTGRTWRVGQRVAVCVREVDVPKGRIDLGLA